MHVAISLMHANHLTCRVRILIEDMHDFHCGTGQAATFKVVANIIYIYIYIYIYILTSIPALSCRA